MTDQEQRETEARYHDLRQGHLERQHHLADLNNDMRQDLSKLEARVEELLLVVPAQRDEGMREALMALNKKVDIIAANVLGDAEDISMETCAEKCLDAFLDKNEDDVNSGVPKSTNGVKNKSDTKSESKVKQEETRAFVQTETPTSPALLPVGQHPTSEVKSSTTVGGSWRKNVAPSDKQLAAGGGDSSSRASEVLSPRRAGRRAEARKRWAKVRMNRAFLVRKIRRQVRVETGCSLSCLPSDLRLKTICCGSHPFNVNADFRCRPDSRKRLP